MTLDGDSKFGNSGNPAADADAALARDLQLQEYQNPPKRFKPVDLEVQDSAHEECSASDIEEFGQATEKESRKYRSPPGKRGAVDRNKKADLPTHESSNESDLGYDSYESLGMPFDYSDYSDDSSDSDAIFGMPVYYPSSRNGSSRRPQLAPPRRLSAYDRLLEGMTRRVSLSRHFSSPLLDLIVDHSVGYART